MSEDASDTGTSGRSSSASECDSDFWHEIGLGVGHGEQEEEEEEDWADAAEVFGEAEAAGGDAGGAAGADSDSECAAGGSEGGEGGEDLLNAAIATFLNTSAADLGGLQPIHTYQQQQQDLEQEAPTNDMMDAEALPPPPLPPPPPVVDWRWLALRADEHLQSASGWMPQQLRGRSQVLQFAQSPTFALHKSVINKKHGTLGVVVEPPAPGSSSVRVCYENSNRHLELSTSAVVVRPLAGSLSRPLPEVEQQPVLVQRGKYTRGVGLALRHSGGATASVALIDPATGQQAEKPVPLPATSLFPLLPTELAARCITSPQRRTVQSALAASAGSSGTGGGCNGGDSSGAGGGGSCGGVGPENRMPSAAPGGGDAYGCVAACGGGGGSGRDEGCAGTGGSDAARRPRVWHVPRTQLRAWIHALSVSEHVDFEVEGVTDRRAGLQELELIASGEDLCALLPADDKRRRRQRLASVKLCCTYAAAHGGARNRQRSGRSLGSHRCGCRYALLLYVHASRPDTVVIQEQGGHRQHVPRPTDPNLRLVPEVEDFVYELLNQ